MTEWIVDHLFRLERVEVAFRCFVDDEEDGALELVRLPRLQSLCLSHNGGRGGGRFKLHVNNAAGSFEQVVVEDGSEEEQLRVEAKVRRLLAMKKTQ